MHNCVPLWDKSLFSTFTMFTVFCNFLLIVGPDSGTEQPNLNLLDPEMWTWLRLSTCRLEVDMFGSGGVADQWSYC